MNNLSESKAAWLDAGKVEAGQMYQSEFISAKDAKKKIESLIKKNSAFTEESISLYKAVPSSELYSVIIISENLHRELEKIKLNLDERN